VLPNLLRTSPVPERRIAFYFPFLFLIFFEEPHSDREYDVCAALRQIFSARAAATELLSNFSRSRLAPLGGAAVRLLVLSTRTTARGASFHSTHVDVESTWTMLRSACSL
jgi:hypothetical protein